MKRKLEETVPDEPGKKRREEWVVPEAPRKTRQGGYIRPQNSMVSKRLGFQNKEQLFNPTKDPETHFGNNNVEMLEFMLLQENQILSQTEWESLWPPVSALLEKNAIKNKVINHALKANSHFFRSVWQDENFQHILENTDFRESVIKASVGMICSEFRFFYQTSLADLEKAVLPLMKKLPKDLLKEVIEKVLLTNIDESYSEIHQLDPNAFLKKLWHLSQDVPEKMLLLKTLFFADMSNLIANTLIKTSEQDLAESEIVHKKF